MVRSIRNRSFKETSINEFVNEPISVFSVEYNIYMAQYLATTSLYHAEP